MATRQRLAGALVLAAALLSAPVLAHQQPPKKGPPGPPPGKGRPADPKPPSGPPPGKGPPAEPRPPREAHRVCGILSAIDGQGFITLTRPDGKSIQLQVVDRTEIFVKRHKATLADLQVGMRAGAAYEPGTPPIATRIVAAVPAPEKELDE